MSSINSLSASQYYQLPTTAGQSQTSTGALESELANLLDSSQDASTSTNSLGSTLSSLLDPSQSDSSGVSDLVDLSPEAQNILSGLNTGTTGSSADTSDDSSNASFVLTPAQQQKVTQILSEYAGQPMTQANYDNLQNDLNAAGVGPQQLSAIDSAQSFDPTQVFIDALDGITDPLNISSPDSSTEQTKAANYMAQIVSQWQNMSGQASSAGTEVAATGGTAAS